MPTERRTVAVRTRLDAALCSPRYVLVLAVVGALVAVLSEALVYPGFSWNRDEPVYLWQAELLRSGHLTGTDGGFPEVFHPWLSGHHDGRFFSQYPLGWPLAIAVATSVGWPGLALAGAAALAVSGSYRLAHEVTGERRTAALGTTLLVLSPIVAVQSGVYLTYMFALGLGTWFAATFLAGVRTADRRLLVLSGVLLGGIVVTRTYDAVVWSAVVGGYVLVTERHRWRDHLRLVGPFVAAVLPFVVAQLAHNRYLTGDPFEFPITVADPLDRFGFGTRRLMPGHDPVAYGPRVAATSSLKNAFFLPWFLVGSYLGAAVAAYGAFDRRRERSTWLLVAIGLGFPAGYFLFWGMHVSALTTRLSGPIYYIPTYVPLCVLMAWGLLALVRDHPRLAGAVAAVGLLVTVPVGLGRLGLNRELSRTQTVWESSTADLDGPALVVTSPSRYLMYLNPFGRNGADLDDDVLFATDAGPSIIEVIDAHPERRALLQRGTVPTEAQLPKEDSERYDVELVPIEITRGEAIEVAVEVDVPHDAAVSVGIDVDGDRTWQDLEVASAGTTLRTTWTLVTEGAAGPGVVVLPPEGTTVEVLVGLRSTHEGSRAEPDVSHRFHVWAGPGLRAMQPGTSYRPDPEVEDRVVWRDTVDPPELSISLRATAAP